MNKEAEREVLGWMWADVEALLWKLVNAHAAGTGEDPDELMSVAAWGFMQAARTYDRERGEFATWAGYKVGKALLLDRMKKAEHFSRWKQAEEEALELVPDRHQFDLREFLEGLSEDARLVARMAAGETRDAELELCCRKDTPAREPEPRDVWDAVRRTLIGMGWTARRVWESYKEIGRALTS